jgi:bifunctional non-homologous end joining protein LigD
MSEPFVLPATRGRSEVTVEVDGREVRLTNLEKVFWPETGITKGDLLQYYAEIAPVLLPHLRDRAMVMKRYPHGIDGEFFFMQRAPKPRPAWIRTCSIEHGSGSVIDFPMIQDTAALLWVINLGCVDLNPWYSRCDDTDRPDHLHFDLDPVPDAGWERVVETALLVDDALRALGMTVYFKTTGSKGLHLYVPIVRGPLQKQVWTFAKKLAKTLESHAPHLVTAEYRIAKRPPDRRLQPERVGAHPCVCLLGAAQARRAGICTCAPLGTRGRRSPRGLRHVQCPCARSAAWRSLAPAHRG